MCAREEVEREGEDLLRDFDDEKREKREDYPL
jgi:hypothetical protein